MYQEKCDFFPSKSIEAELLLMERMLTISVKVEVGGWNFFFFLKIEGKQDQVQYSQRAAAGCT